MPPNSADSSPTDRELQALKVLWERGEATVRDIYEVLTAGKEDLAYTTVLTLLQVMEQKGLVSHRRVGKAYLYQPLLEETRTLRHLARGFLERVFDGAMDQYVAHALGNRKLSAKEFAELEALLAAAKRKKSDR